MEHVEGNINEDFNNYEDDNRDMDYDYDNRDLHHKRLRHTGRDL